MRLRIMYLSPVADTLGGTNLFVEAARDHVLPDTEAHLVTLPGGIGRFSHVEYRTCAAMVTAGTVRATATVAEEGFDALAVGRFYDTAVAQMVARATARNRDGKAGRFPRRRAVRQPHHRQPIASQSLAGGRFP